MTQLTSSQQSAVEHRGSTLLVAASAGSGKTEVLAQRCVSLVRDATAPLDISQLLVVTFTRAAAAELKVRIARMLHQAARAATDAAEQRRLQRQALLADTADIGTIDAWCQQVLRSHFAEAGIDVNFTVLAEDDAFLLRRRILEELFTEIHRTAARLHTRVRDWLARAHRPNATWLRDIVAELSWWRENLVNPDAWLAEQRQQGPPEPLLAQAIAAECRFQAAQLAALLRGQGAAPEPRLQEYATMLRRWERGLADPARLRDVVAAIGGAQFPQQPRGGAKNPQVEEIKKRWFTKRLKEKWKAERVQQICDYVADAADLLGTVLDLEAAYQGRLWEAKQAAATFEFADVLRLTLDLLGTPGLGQERTPTAVARQLQQRYAHVLVDEYQDTSPVQVELLRLASRSAPGQSNRFLVGDVKQSIYGFRQAEPRLFTALRDALAQGAAEGRVQYLADNFRSHPDILAALNGLFAALFDAELGGTTFGTDEQLVARRAEIANRTLTDEPRVHVHVIDEPKRKRSKDAAPSPPRKTAEDELVERIEREAQVAADEIHRLLAAGTQVPQRGPDGGVTLRPLALRDIVILLRAAQGNAPRIAAVLRDNGLACSTSGRDDLLKETYVQDVCQVLRLLVNRRHDVALAAYLRGPFVELAPADLLTLRSAEPRGEFHGAVATYLRRGEKTPLAQRVARAWKQLDLWCDLAREVELPTLVQSIIHAGGLTHFARALPGGAHRVALLQALQGLAASAAARGQTLAEFVEHLDALEEETRGPQAIAAAEDDVIRILTIHASKGLEYPVVFVLGVGSKLHIQRRKSELQVDADAGVGLRFFDYRARAHVMNATHVLAAHAVKRRELEEELRLLYVATTRAREYLALIGHHSLEKWEPLRQQTAAALGPPPLMARQNASSKLEWVLLALASGTLQEPRGKRPALVGLHEYKLQDVVLAAPEVRPERAAPPVTLDLSDEAWLNAGLRQLTTQLDPTLAQTPAVLAVSVFKHAALAAANAADVPEARRVRSRPRVPYFAQAPAADGRTLGTACHVFLEGADLARLATEADVEAQIAAQVAAGRLTPADAALVPKVDITWLARTPLGALLAQRQGALRREVPFVYAWPLAQYPERVIVRGVIDCLIEQPDGLVVVDYKTDCVTDGPQLQRRIAAYSAQLRCYAHAAGAICGRPVVQCWLAFLRARQIVAVSPGTPVLPAVGVQLAESML